MRLSSLGAVGVVSVFLFSASALANSTGVTTRSGKNPSMTCAGSTCHSGTAARPVVTLTGPDSLNAGETGTFTITISGGPAVAGGMNVAVDNAQASLQPGTGQKKQGAEITHSAPKDFANNTVSFDFTMIAPAAGGTVRIFGAGNSVNKDGANTGDTSAAVTKDVTIVGSGTDGGTQPDGGTDPDEEMPGCGCSAGSSAPLFPLLALLAAGARRRRRS
jgi:MYXO-CTERM domain-containing protein